MIAENTQYWPEILQAKKLINENKIGDVLNIYARNWESAMGPWSDDYKPGAWRCKNELFPHELFPLDSASHWLRPLYLLLGEFESVVGLMNPTLPYMKGNTMVQALFKFKNGK